MQHTHEGIDSSVVVSGPGQPAGAEADVWPARHHQSEAVQVCYPL